MHLKFIFVICLAMAVQDDAKTELTKSVEESDVDNDGKIDFRVTKHLEGDSRVLTVLEKYAPTGSRKSLSHFVYANNQPVYEEHIGFTEPPIHTVKFYPDSGMQVSLSDGNGKVNVRGKTLIIHDKDMKNLVILERDEESILRPYSEQEVEETLKQTCPIIEFAEEVIEEAFGSDEEQESAQ